MKKYETGYFIREGVRGIFLHGFMSFAAVGVIVACLLIMGSFSLLAFNMDSMIRDVQGDNELLVFIEETLTRDQALSLGTEIAQIENVYRRDFVTRDQALDEYTDKMDEENRWLFEGLDDNPLRDRYIVHLEDVERMQETIEELESLPGVAWINARPDIVQQLGKMRSAVNAICLLLIVMLMAVSVFIISNTIKLATFARREEIGIMRVVGATKQFIRWPFIIEGFLLGLMGAVIAFLLQWRVYGIFVNSIQNMLSSVALIRSVPFGEILWPMLAVFLLAGFLAGVGGSVLTIRRFLKI